MEQRDNFRERGNFTLGLPLHIAQTAKLDRHDPSDSLALCRRVFGAVCLLSIRLNWFCNYFSSSSCG